MSQGEGASTRWKGWLDKYAARIESEKEEWVSASSDGDWQAQREKDARLANPRFVLRQWVLEEVIAKVETDTQNGRCVLAKVMQVSNRSTTSVHQLTDLICRWHVIPSSRGVGMEMSKQLMSWMRRRGRRGGYVVSAIEVCLGSSAAVPVRPCMVKYPRLDDTRCFAAKGTGACRTVPSRSRDYSKCYSKSRWTDCLKTTTV
jgi:hypothetical protein